MHLAFSTGFNVVFNPDVDIHALQRTVDHYVRLLATSDVTPDWSMDVEFVAGRVRLARQEVDCLVRSSVDDTLAIVGDQGERHRLIVTASDRALGSILPQSQHQTSQAMDVAVPDRPDHVMIDTHLGARRLTTEGDMPVLRRWFLDNIVDGLQIAVPVRDVVLDLPDAGRVVLEPNHVRHLATALIAARQVEEDGPVRAVASVGDRNYVQGQSEDLADYEQRVIQDMMLRRGRDLMRDEGMSPERAAAEVHRLLEQEGVTGLSPRTNVTQSPTPEMERNISRLTVDEHGRLARIIAEWYLVDELTPEARELVERVGLTEPVIRWFNMQIVEGMDRLPETVMDPTLMEVWRD